MYNSNNGSILHHDIFDTENTATLQSGSDFTEGHWN